MKKDLKNKQKMPDRQANKTKSEDKKVALKFRGSVRNLYVLAILVFCTPVLFFNVFYAEMTKMSVSKVCSLESNMQKASSNVESIKDDATNMNATGKVKKKNDKMQLYIIMYHSIQKNDKYKGKYILPVWLFERDLQYFNSQGYEYINAGDLIDFIYEDKDMPEKAIMLTFDDGHYNFKTNVIPLLEKYDAKACVSVVGEYTLNDEINKDKNDRYSYLTAEDLEEIDDLDRVSILNHSYALHKIDSNIYGAMKIANETDDTYAKRFISDTMAQEFLFEQHHIKHELFYTYPYGGASSLSKAVLKNIGMLGSFSCVEGINIVTRDKNSIYDLKRYNRAYSAKSSAEYFYDIIKWQD